MALTQFSADARGALLQRFPELASHTKASSDGKHVEIRLPHPSGKRELLITTADDEISIFFDGDHRHIGMNEQLSTDEQIRRGVQFIADLLSGTMPLVRDARRPDVSFYDDPSVWGHDPDEKLTFMTWQTLAI
jgi:hypothetical protein